MVGQFHFDPDSYAKLIASEVPAYQRLQDAVAEATMDIDARHILDLGAGTGVTAHSVASRHPDATVLGIDESAAMLEHAHRLLPHADLRVARLEDDLPTGSFDVVVSALAVHHLDASHKADLFVRVARIVAPGGRFVLGDLIVPDDPADLVTPIDGDYDQPSTILRSSNGSQTQDSPLTSPGSTETSPSWSATYPVADRHRRSRFSIPGWRPPNRADVLSTALPDMAACGSPSQ